MAGRRFHYRWDWELEAGPEALWPLVADTNRFNRDAGVPALEVVPADERRLRIRRFGIPVEWTEEPFEWIRPHRFSVMRRYHRGPVAEMRVAVALSPRAGGGTLLTYEVSAQPRNVLGTLAIPIEIGVRSRRRFAETFRRYDRIALARGPTSEGPAKPRLASQRLRALRERLLAQGQERGLVDRLLETVEQGDELTLARLRPYAVADAWKADRSSVLELFLHATRAGLLDLRWDVLCPLCRGPKETSDGLAGLDSNVHCDHCKIDFAVNFEHSVELTFTPNASVREVERVDFCVGGPQLTPHVVLQQLLPAGETRTLSPSLEPGRHRLRTDGLPGHQPVLVLDDGPAEGEVRVAPGGWSADELRLGTAPSVRVVNETPSAQLLLVERTAWSDDAATAADVTALQVFRDLVAPEALRPAEPISIGSLAVLFTDLLDSTRYYREVGDAPAFGSVMEHLDVLRTVVAGEEGALVKTMGDAILAVFRRPAAAVRAALRAQRELAEARGPLPLKVGIHFGPCIAVDQNERLDYFGSTVNAAARLVGLSTGADVVVSGAVRHDPEVAELLEGLTVEPLEATLKGFDGERFELWRVSEAASPRKAKSA